VLLVFVRAPRPGSVKTRLAAALGDDGALAVYRRLAEHTVAVARELAGDGVEVRVHHTPADAGAEVRAWLGDGPRYLPQGEGSLGERMEEAFRRAFAGGARRVVIVGSDLPGLSSELLRRAFDALGEREAVVGPARDGGYYLLGLVRPVEWVFRGIRWSTPEVLPATLARLRAAGAEPLLLEALADVDEAGDLPPGWV
jgi:rSAM/selenodomain-associated transferase 1